MSDIITLTPQMMVVLAILAFTIFLFVSEIVRIDVAAIAIMVLLGLLSMVPALPDIADTETLLNGFASNAVMSIIAVMIIGAGLDKTGVMSRLASLIIRFGGRTEARIIPLVSGSSGIISSFMQNVGAAALYIPVVNRIAARTGLPKSRLLMPMGFCCILGGTITMVGSSPLILLNDLLPEGMDTFELFDVTPIGLALIATGIGYFVLFGRFVLPTTAPDHGDVESVVDYYHRVYGMNFIIREVRVESRDPLVGQTLLSLEQAHGVVVIASFMNSELRVGPWGGLTIEPGARLAVLASQDAMDKLANHKGFEVFDQLDVFADVLSPTKSGMAEVVIPPRSELIGKSVRDIAMRKTHGLSVLAIHSGGETLDDRFRDHALKSGDVLVSHCRWDALMLLEKNRDFVVMTTEYPKEELRPKKVRMAVLWFSIALFLVLFTDLRLSVALLTGALGMILTGVLTMDEAYGAVSWKTVFLLASLIPLGAAVEQTGTAAWIAQNTLAILGDVSPWVLQAAIAVLATFFTLVMSNVGATVLLVPLAINIAIAAQATGMEADPRVFALTAAIATSNSFLIPTHQVNALIMGPGGYRVKDYMKAGLGMTALFIVVSMVMLNIVF
ncbi:MAG: SLC13 family permease [Saccharospirillum sp.]